jgi:hypothetical protein
MATSAAAERALATVPAHSSFGGPKTPSWQRSVVEQIVSVLYEYRVELAAAFSVFDVNHDGRISREEFLAGLSALTELAGTAITPTQAEELLKALDKDGDGEISFTEFVEGFRLVDTGVPENAAGSAPPPAKELVWRGGSAAASGGGGAAAHPAPPAIHAPAAAAPRSAGGGSVIAPPRLGVQSVRGAASFGGGATPSAAKTPVSKGR